MKNKKTSIILCIFSFLIVIGIFGFSAQTGEESGNISQKFTEKFLDIFGLTEANVNRAEHILRKCAHVLEYALMGALIYVLALRIPKIQTPACLPSALAFVITFLYAVTDEIHQIFIPGRGPSVRDVLLDGIGALIGILMIMSIRFCVAYKRKKADKIMR